MSKVENRAPPRPFAVNPQTTNPPEDAKITIRTDIESETALEIEGEKVRCTSQSLVHSFRRLCYVVARVLGKLREKEKERERWSKRKNKREK